MEPDDKEICKNVLSVTFLENMVIVHKRIWFILIGNKLIIVIKRKKFKNFVLISNNITINGQKRYLKILF